MRPGSTPRRWRLLLTGRVYPIGGVREKLLAAKRQKIGQVILPAANERDFEEVPEHIRRGLKVHFVENFEEVVALAFKSRVPN